MAKKTAAKKKAAPAKAKSPAKASVKSSKSAKPVKAEKPAKTVKPVKVVPAPRALKTSSAKPEPKAAKPSLMTKKGTETSAPEEAPEPKKTATVVSMLESSDSTQEPANVEKVSKIKPVKVDRGNLNDEKAKWAELFKKYGKEKALTYKMSESYQSLIPLQHKVLGWGFVLTNENDRLEVLFENGIRMLISNYKS
jgi:hypothetical protein